MVAIWGKNLHILIKLYDTPLSDQHVIWNFQQKFELNITLYGEVIAISITIKIRHFLY